VCVCAQRSAAPPPLLLFFPSASLPLSAMSALDVNDAIRKCMQIMTIAPPVVPEGTTLMWVIESEDGSLSTFPKETKEEALAMAYKFPKGTVCHLFALSCKPATCGDIADMLQKKNEPAATPFSRFTI
jgi:hypothetical protein